MNEYRRAPDVALVAQEILAKYHPKLRSARVEYLYLDTMTSRGRDVWARIEKPTKREKFFIECDLIVTVSELAWDRLTPDQRRALVDHEFHHVTYNDAREAYEMVHHDLEEFLAIVKRHGKWKEDVREFVEGVQGEMFEGKPK